MNLIYPEYDLLIRIKPFILSLINSLLVLILTIILLGFSRYNKKFDYKYFQEPRQHIYNMSDLQRRIQWSHNNSFEAFIIHSVGLLLAIIISSNGLYLGRLVSDVAMIHPLFRILYIIMYMYNRPVFRAFFWGAGLISSLFIYFKCFTLISLL